MSISVRQTYGSKNLPISCPGTVYKIGFPTGQTHGSDLLDKPIGKTYIVDRPVEKRGCLLRR